MPMTFSRPEADLYIPDGASFDQALARTTHLCVAAHQDDVEIMAQAGIDDCKDGPGRFFTAVVGTDGAGSPRTGPYAGLTDGQMKLVRRGEQRRAAEIGGYGLMIQLAHPSSDVKRPGAAGVRSDLAAIFGGCRPEVVFLHNPADKHDTHVGLLLRCLEALRSLPPERRPRRVLGCEVWRGLDWIVDADKIPLDAGRRPDLALALLKVFDSQVAGGKRYDLAAIGRRAANATFHTSHQSDRMAGVIWAMDLSPLVADPALSVAAYTLAYVDRLRADIADRLSRLA